MFLSDISLTVPLSITLIHLMMRPSRLLQVYGWLYRVYPEPWQVHLEIVKPGKDGNPEVRNVLVESMKEKPSYDKVVSLLLKASQANK
jgi:hypothetical protein